MRLLLRIVLAVLALFAAVLAAELATRWLDPFGASYYRDNHRYFAEAVDSVLDEPGGRGPEGRLFQNLPGTDLALRRFRFRTDAFGLRCAETGRAAPVPRAPGGPLRILCVGDSATLAWGVDDADSWVRALERRGRAADGGAIECLNAGHLLYDSVQEADLLRVWGPLLRPDVVVVMFSANDLVPSYQSIVDPPEPVEAGPFPAWLARTLPALRDLWTYRSQAAELEDVLERAFDTLGELPGYPENWPRCRDALAEMRATCAALDARFVVLDLAVPRIPELATWCEAAGVARVDALFTDEEWREDIRNSAADAHFNARGNAYIAEKVVRGLAELGILAAP